MRAYNLHAPFKQIQRSSGRSSVAASAYRSAGRLYDERTGQWHDYTRKGGVEHSQIYTPDGAPAWAHDRGQLWNAAEAKENRRNSAVAHELELGLPAEFNADQRREAGASIAHELVRRYGCAVDIAYHQPSREGDDRNFHAHILFTTRSLDPERPDGWASTKFRDLSQDPVTVDGERTTRGKLEIPNFKAFIAGELNRIAERDRLDVRTEHLSYEERGIDREPTQHLGPTATKMEREGKASRRGDHNRQVEAANDNQAQLEREARVVDLAIEREKRRLSREADDGGLSLSQQLEAFYGRREASLTADIDAAAYALDHQSALQRFWYGFTGHNARQRDELAEMRAMLEQVQASRAAEQARLVELEETRRQADERECRERQDEHDRMQADRRAADAAELDKKRNDERQQEQVRKDHQRSLQARQTAERAQKAAQDQRAADAFAAAQRAQAEQERTAEQARADQQRQAESEAAADSAERQAEADDFERTVDMFRQAEAERSRKNERDFGF